MTGEDAAVGNGSRPIEENDLQAWIDGRLPPDRHRFVEAWLDANPAAAARVRAMATQCAMLRDGLRQALSEPIPLRLRVAALLAARRRERRRLLALSAASAGSLAAGLAIGWVGRDLLGRPGGTTDEGPGLAARGSDTPSDGGMVAEAVAAHRVFTVDARRPVEVAAAQEAQLVQWLSNRLGRRLPVPDLAPLGLRLIGGRLLPGAEGRPAAQLMYEAEGGERLTVYLRADASDQRTAFRFVQDPATGIGAFWWVDRGFGYAVAAKADRDGLLRVAEAVYHQLGG